MPIENENAMLGTVTFRGQSGEFYRFNVLPSDEIRTAKSCVCMFTQRTYNGTATLSRDVTGTHNIMFVRKAEDIHDSEADEIIAIGANCVCILVVDNKKKREEIERDLIEKYHPEYNNKLKVLAASA